MFSLSCRKRSIIVSAIIVVGILPVLLYSLVTYPGVSGPIEPSAFRDSPLHEQWAAVLTGFGVKPAYMALSLVLVIILWRRKLPELAALRWGLLCFFLGEAFCAANYLIYSEDSYLFEYFHSLGMLLCFGFVTYALFEGLDRWLVGYTNSDERCAALPLCHSCIKYSEVPCGLRRMFYILIAAPIILAFVPLTAQLHPFSYNTNIVGTFYNYSHPVIYQLFEIRYLPIAAIVLLTASLLALIFAKRHEIVWPKILFSGGMGALGFSLMRLFLYAAYSQNQVWFAFWEEMTELVFVIGVGITLWIFRRGLLPERKAGRADVRE